MVQNPDVEFTVTLTESYGKYGVDRSSLVSSFAINNNFIQRFELVRILNEVHSLVYLIRFTNTSARVLDINVVLGSLFSERSDRTRSLLST